MTHNQFKNYLTQVRPDIVARVDMFVVRPEGLPVIHEVGKEKQTLRELGVLDLTNIVIFDSEIQPENSANKTEYYHIIGERFGIPKSEYAALMPKVRDSQVSDVHPSDFLRNQPSYHFNAAIQPQ